MRWPDARTMTFFATSRPEPAALVELPQPESRLLQCFSNGLWVLLPDHSRALLRPSDDAHRFGISDLTQKQRRVCRDDELDGLRGPAKMLCESRYCIWMDVVLWFLDAHESCAGFAQQGRDQGEHPQRPARRPDWAQGQ